MTLTPKDIYFRKIVQESVEIWPQTHAEFALGPGHPAEISELYDRLEDIAEVTAAAMAREETEYYGVLLEVAEERERQDAKWGVQDMPSIVPAHIGHAERAAYAYSILTAQTAKEICQHLAAKGECTWADVLIEEVCEAIEAAAIDPGNLRTELIQVAAVAVQWVEALDRAGVSERADAA